MLCRKKKIFGWLLKKKESNLLNCIYIRDALNFCFIMKVGHWLKPWGGEEGSSSRCFFIGEKFKIQPYIDGRGYE